MYRPFAMQLPSSNKVFVCEGSLDTMLRETETETEEHQASAVSLLARHVRGQSPATPKAIGQSGDTRRSATFRDTRALLYLSFTSQSNVRRQKLHDALEPSTDSAVA
jgi:hypothetical protein